MKENASDRVKVRFPIGVKLAIIIGLVVLVSLNTVTILNSYFIGQDVQITAENNNLSTNTRGAETLEDKFTTIRSNTFQLLDLVNVLGGQDAPVRRQAENFFFERNADIISVAILQDDGERDIFLVNNKFFLSNEIEQTALDAFLASETDAITRSCSGETIAINSSPFLGVASMSLLFPWKEYGKDQTCIITFSIESISDILGTDTINTTFLINDSDELLFHPDSTRVIRGESFKNHPLIIAMRNNNQNNDDSRQIPFEVQADTESTENIVPTVTEFTDKNDKSALFIFNIVKTKFNELKNKLNLTNNQTKAKQYFGAYRKLTIGDMVLCTTVSLDTVLEGVRTTRRNNSYLTGIVFFLSIIIILIFARYGISNHLRNLTVAANEIQQGNFETTSVDKLNTKRHDELGVLNQSTKNELSFLTLFSKFTNKAVAKAIARNEIDFDPHLKDITIFFSDIRGFTSISDGFKNRFKDDSPREIIAFLNDYMSRMVNCITLSGGNVDKFEGDAIMAVWGLLREDNLDFEHLPEESAARKKAQELHDAHRIEDAINAIRGTIAMRYALMKYNKDADAFNAEHSSRDTNEIEKFKPHIRIGCGLNCGRATCGIMGSEDKMEYTAIGDAVNFASRTESSNKPCGTDILLSSDMVLLLKQRFIRCGSNNFKIAPEDLENEIVVEGIPVKFEVKGKGEQYFFGVVNMPNFDIEKFFLKGDKNFQIDEDCRKAVGPTGPKTLDEVRTMLGIPIPDFSKVNLNEEENKVQAKK